MYIRLCRIFLCVNFTFPEVLNHHFSTIFHSLLLNLRFSLQSYSWYNFRKLLSAHHFRLFRHMLSIYLPKSLLLVIVNFCVLNFSDCADLGAILRGEGLQLREGVGDIKKKN